MMLETEGDPAFRSVFALQEVVGDFGEAFGVGAEWQKCLVGGVGEAGGFAARGVESDDGGVG